MLAVLSRLQLSNDCEFFLRQAIMLDPHIWLGKARILCAAYPDIDWYRVSLLARRHRVMQAAG